MKSLTNTFLLLLLSANTFAVEIPNEFQDGQVTSASQMNENFQALKVEIEALKSQISTIQSTTRTQFRGFSNDAVSGLAGFFAMLEACENFVAESHVCSSDEISGSRRGDYAMSTVNGDAWVLPSIKSGSSQSGWGSTLGNTFSGTSSYRNCENWNTTNIVHTGTVVRSNGSISTRSCGSTLKVACCK